MLAFFPSEDLVDEAAMVLKDWEKANEYMKIDAVGVLVKDKNGKVKQHKLGKQAGKKGMGVGRRSGRGRGDTDRWPLPARQCGRRSRRGPASSASSTRVSK